MWIFLSAISYAAPPVDAAPPPETAPVSLPNAILVEDAGTLLVIQRQEDVWRIIHKMEKLDFMYYDIYDVLDLDGNGDVEIILTVQMEGTAVVFPSVSILKLKNNAYEDVTGADLMLDGDLEMIKSKNTYTFRLHSELPGSYTDYVLSGMTLQELPRVFAVRPAVAPSTTPPWLRGDYGYTFGYCRPMNFSIHETTIEYGYPNIGKATITGVTINADTILLATDLPAPWTVLSLKNVPQSDEIMASWSGSPTGTFEHECSITGGNIPGW